jgi:hypothetical protein
VTPATLVAKLQARGVILRPDGETLKVRPVSKVAAEELEALRQHKAEVLALLTTVPTPTITLNPDALREVLGPAATDPHAVACVKFDVISAVREIEIGMRTGILPPRRFVCGRPLADWLPLDTIAGLLRDFDWTTRGRGVADLRRYATSQESIAAAPAANREPRQAVLSTRLSHCRVSGSRRDA